MQTVRPHSRSRIQAVVPTAVARRAAPPVVDGEGLGYGWSSEFQAAYERVAASGTPCAG
jgi:hypothetical protein